MSVSGVAVVAAAFVHVSVTPMSTSLDQPVHMRVSGLKPQAAATLSLQGRDARRRLWHSSARFRADARGRIDVGHSKALAGSYTGIWGRGLLANLNRKAPKTGTVFYWGDEPRRFKLTVTVAGHAVAATAFRRGLPRSAVREQTLSLAEQGVFGEYYAPEQTASPAPAVLIFGGSEGGLTVGGIRARMLAAHGFPTLAIAYFKELGLPQTLTSIPLEYFEHALLWLAAQPGVDSARIAVIGISRGGEAAQLLGVHYPQLVHAVVAASSSNAAACSFPTCDGPAWTLDGAPLPYVAGTPVPQVEGDGVIADELIHGPVFLICGGHDIIALSCPYARATIKRLRRFHHPYADELDAYPHAGHYVGGLLPGLPYAPHELFYAADEQARENLWPKLLGFLSTS